MAEDPEAAKLKAFKLRLVLVPPSTVCSYIEPLEKAPEGCLDSNAHIQDGMEPVMFGPNITGSFRMWKTYLDDSLASCDGAFSFIVEQQKYTGGSESTVPYRGFTFDASRVSATYGASTVVQPASLCLLPCIKT